jgi:hypothetical protein
MAGTLEYHDAFVLANTTLRKKNITIAHAQKDLGRMLWYARQARLVSRLSSGGTIGLDGVEAMCG